MPYLCAQAGGSKAYLAYGDAGAVYLQSSANGQQWDAAARVQVFTFDPIITVADGGASSVFMLGNISVGGLRQVNITYYEGASDGDTAARFRVARAKNRAATEFWPALTLYSPVTLRTGYGSRWLGDYAGAVDLFGALCFAFVDNSGTGSQAMFTRAILP